MSNSLNGGLFSRILKKFIPDDNIVNIDEKLELGAFGGLLVDNLTPVYHIKGLYNRLNTRLVETFLLNGTVINSNSLYEIAGNVTLFDYAVMRSRRQINYQAGTGIVTRFTAIFDTGTTGYWQLAGLGVTGNGLFFGYNGTDFCVMKQTGGIGEVRRLEITTAENTTATATVSLNGASFNVSLINSGGATEFTAYEICNTGASGWDASCIGDYIYFSSQSTGSKSGSYTYSSTGASAGTFTQITAGVSDTYDWIKQAEWDCDKMNGRGKSGMTLNPQKGNVYQIRYQWLGFGEIDFYIENDDTGKFQLVHSIKYTNRYTIPSLLRPSLKSLFAVYSAGGTGTTLTMKVGSFASYVEGSIEKDDNLWGYTNEKSIPGNTETNIIVLKNKALQNGVINTSEIFINSISVASDGTKNVTIKIYLNGTVGADVTSDYYVYNELDINSIGLIDILSDTITSGTLINSFVLGKSSSLESLALSGIRLERLETLTVTAESSQSTDINIGINWVEDI